MEIETLNDEFLDFSHSSSKETSLWRGREIENKTFQPIYDKKARSTVLADSIVTTTETSFKIDIGGITFEKRKTETITKDLDKDKALLSNCSLRFVPLLSLCLKAA